MNTHMHTAYANEKEFQNLFLEEATSFLLMFHWSEQATSVSGVVEECNFTLEWKGEETLNIDMCTMTSPYSAFSYLRTSITSAWDVPTALLP